MRAERVIQRRSGEKGDETVAGILGRAVSCKTQKHVPGKCHRPHAGWAGVTSRSLGLRSGTQSIENQGPGSSSWLILVAGSQARHVWEQGLCRSKTDDSRAGKYEFKVNQSAEAR